MSGWFTVEEIDSRTFAISEYQHWEETHCYLLLGEARALLIDTGLGVANIREVVHELTKLPVEVATTHAHWDHIGGHKYFERIAVHEAEREWLRGKFPLPLEAVKRSLTSHNCDFPPEFDLDAYQIFRGEPQRILHDGDCLDPGGREIRVLHTPGHSPGHCCFYEPGRNFLFSGDPIYAGCLCAFYPTTDPMRFYHSIQRLRGERIDRILPGHHRLDIPTSLIGEIEAGFAQLDRDGLLHHGSGKFDFGSFQLQI